MFWIIGGDGAIWALAEMLRGKSSTLDRIGAFLNTQMTHVRGRDSNFTILFFHSSFLLLACRSFCRRPGWPSAKEGMLRMFAYYVERCCSMLLASSTTAA